MADEIVITEYKQPEGGLHASIGGKVITTQVLDIGTRSAEFNADTKYVSIASRGVEVWFKTGDSAVNAAADTDGNSWIPADVLIVLAVDESTRYIDTAAAS